jgi:hypothetical protein
MVSWPVCLGVKHPSGVQDQIFITVRQLWFVALTDERMGLSFTIAVGPRQHSHSWIRVPRNSWPYFTISDSRFLQPGRPGPCIYILQEWGGPILLPGTGFPFCRLIRLSGLPWSYVNPSPCVVARNSQYIIDPLCSLGTDHIENMSPNRSSIVVSCSYRHRLLKELS